MAGAWERRVYQSPTTYFGGEDWSGEWPEKEPEAGCLAACFSDSTATDESAKVRGLGHAYLSVVANEGILLFDCLILFGFSLGALSVWLTVRLVQTRGLVLIVPLVPSSLLALYCWVYLGLLKYRFRRLFCEVLIWPFATVFDFLQRLFRKTPKVQPRESTSTMRLGENSFLDDSGTCKGESLHLKSSQMDDGLPHSSVVDFDWSMARQWITSCREHPLCQNDFLQEEQRAFLPRRLLEVIPASYTDGSSSEKSGLACPPEVRLVETSSIDRTHHETLYVALSHFTGDIAQEHMVSRLTTSNLEKLKVSLPYGALPPSFRDAIAITNRIGFSYLWIDALCVMDDSEEEQELQRKQSGLVFSNSVCTISMSVPARQPGIRLTNVPETNPSLEGTSIDKLKDLVPYRAKDTIDELFLRHVDFRLLNRWSWSYFQERLLSRRVLHICDKTEILFECNTMRASRHPQHLRGVPYPVSTSSTSCRQALAPKPMVPGSIKAGDTAKTYTYETRRKVIDETSGAFKFETVVVTKDHYPSVQEQLEALQYSLAWRRHRGAFERVLRPTKDLESYIGQHQTPEATRLQVEERLGLHKAWLGMVEAHSCSASLLNKGTKDRYGKRLLGLNGVVDIIAQTHKRDNFQAVLGPYVAGLWLGMMPFNMLWHRSNPIIVALPQEADPGFFSEYRGSVMHYKAPPASLDARDHGPSEYSIPTWSWASVDGQVSHSLPFSLVRDSGERSANGGVVRSLKKLFTSSKPQPQQPATDQPRTWNMARPLIDPVEMYDHWTPITTGFVNSDGVNILPNELSQLRLRIRHLYPLFALPAPREGFKGIRVFYDSIGRLHQAIYPCHDHTTRAVFGLPVLEVSNWGNDPVGIDRSKWKRQVHGLALRHVKTLDGRGDVYERVGYFQTTDQEVIDRILLVQTSGSEGVVWLQ
ncbi:hypothetical protein V8F20_006913 [Naviculisporaceae sp. PSN 640]